MSTTDPTAETLPNPRRHALETTDYRIHALCARHDITVEGIVALVDALLRWGENVANGDLALTLLHAMDDTPVPHKYEMTGRDLEVLANACLAALRTEAGR